MASQRPECDPVSSMGKCELEGFVRRMAIRAARLSRIACQRKLMATGKRNLEVSMYRVATRAARVSKMPLKVRVLARVSAIYGCSLPSYVQVWALSLQWFLA